MTLPLRSLSLRLAVLCLPACLVSPLVRARDISVSSPEDLSAAVAAAQPGDALVLARGTWRDAKLSFNARGLPEKPVTLRAETPGETIFTGASELVIDGEHLVVSGLKFQGNAGVTSVVTPYAVTVASVITFTARASHCRLTETAILDSGEGVTTYVHLEPGNVSNRVDHCYFSNQGKIGVTFYVQVHPSRPNGHLVDHNYFGDRRQGTGNRWETIRIGHSDQQRFVSNTTVAHNYFYRCNGENECISNKSTGNRYLYNALVEVRGQLTLRHGDRTWVEGNYFDGGSEAAAEGVRVIGSDQVVINNYFKDLRTALIVYNGQSGTEAKDYAPVTNALIAFNTFDGCAENFSLAPNNRPVPPKGVRIVGNLVQAKSGKIIAVRGTGEYAYEGNVMFGAELGVEAPTGISSETLRLARDAAGRLAPPAVRVPLPASGEATKDLDGAPRTSPSPVGALAVAGSRPLYPRTKAEVGPAWMGRAR